MKRKFYRLCNKSFDELQVTNYQELWEKVKDKGFSGLILECITEFKKSEADDNKFHAIFSTAAEDRHGDIVMQEWDLKAYKKNPVYLDSHNYDSIEHIIGRVENIAVKDGKLQGDIVFALDNPKGKLAYDLVKGGFLNTNSVGFIPKKFDDKGKILESELLENSGVAVPANYQALITNFYESEHKKNIENETDNGESAGQGDAGQGGGEADKSENKSANGQRIAKEFENWDEGNDFIRLKIRDLELFEDNTLARVTYKDSTPVIKAIIGQMKGDSVKKIQMLIFDKNEGWNVDDAKKYFSVNQEKITNWTNAIEEVKSIEDKDVVSRVIVKMAGQIKSKDDKRNNYLKKVLQIINDEIGGGQVETRLNAGKADKRRKLNQAVRNLLEAKKLI